MDTTRKGEGGMSWEIQIDVYTLQKGIAAPPVFLPGEFHRQGNLADYSPRGHKELEMTDWLTLYFHFHKEDN